MVGKWYAAQPDHAAAAMAALPPTPTLESTGMSAFWELEVALIHTLTFVMENIDLCLPAARTSQMSASLIKYAEAVFKHGYTKEQVGVCDPWGALSARMD
jgi:hypothetical protein